MKRQRSEEESSTVEKDKNDLSQLLLSPTSSSLSSSSLTSPSQSVTTTTTSTSSTTFKSDTTELSGTSNESIAKSLSSIDRTTLQILSHIPEINISHRDKRGRRGAVYVGSMTSDTYIDALSAVLTSNTNVLLPSSVPTSSERSTTTKIDQSTTTTIDLQIPSLHSFIHAEQNECTIKISSLIDSPGTFTIDETLPLQGQSSAIMMTGNKPTSPAIPGTTTLSSTDVKDSVDHNE